MNLIAWYSIGEIMWKVKFQESHVLTGLNNCIQTTTTQHPHTHTNTPGHISMFSLSWDCLVCCMDREFSLPEFAKFQFHIALESWVRKNNRSTLTVYMIVFFKGLPHPAVTLYRYESFTCCFSLLEFMDLWWHLTTKPSFYPDFSSSRIGPLEKMIACCQRASTLVCDLRTQNR